MTRARRAGFSLIELLVALAVFAALAAAAYGGLSGITRLRGELAARQDRFAAVVRAMSTLERDLRQAVSRPIRASAQITPLPALAGAADRIEFTRLGFANPRAEPRSNLERFAYGIDATTLQRAHFAMLDRAPNSMPATTALLDRVSGFNLRYLGPDGIWRVVWPPVDANGTADPAMLPRAVEFRLDVADIGALRRVIELPTTIPACAADAPPGTCNAP